MISLIDVNSGICSKNKGNSLQIVTQKREFLKIRIVKSRLPSIRFHEDYATCHATVTPRWASIPPDAFRANPATCEQVKE